MAKEQQTIDQRELLGKVTSNEINWRDALDIITSLKKPWHTKEWKEQRKVLLASQCENCGTSTPPLVLQHTWHPTPIYKLFYTARKKYENEWQLWNQIHTFEVDTSSLVPDTDGCPKCGSTTIRYRKRPKLGSVFRSPKVLLAEMSLILQFMSFLLRRFGALRKQQVKSFRMLLTKNWGLVKKL